MRPWGRALGWLLLLAPFFFATYNLANWLAARRSHVGAIVFDWEQRIPFVAWTIVPYWTIDFFYGLSLFVCADKAELDTHARRLLTAQIICVTCFILFPLRFSFPKPAADGFSGFLFDQLASFDKPFNQAPSLHIALLVILWVLYVRHVAGWARWLVHAWAAVIGVSVLTTYQHHFIDLPTGGLAGLLCLWLWPDGRPSPVMTAAWTRSGQRLKLASGYAVGALACAAIGVALGGAWLWLLWGSVALALVAANYALFGAAGFQKAENGRMSLAAWLMLTPYLAGAWLNSRAWTRGRAPSVAIADGVWLGRLPSRREAARFPAIVDLCAELPDLCPGVRAVPMLDLVTPAGASLRQAALLIEAARQGGPVLVCCALGYSRSAASVAAWLVTTGRAASAEAAVARIGEVRRVVLGPAHLAAIRN